MEIKIGKNVENIEKQKNNSNNGKNMQAKFHKMEKI
jgi:hypothetical protein